MTEPNEMTFLLAMVIGGVLMLAGFYALKTLDPPMAVRVGLGAVLFSIGLVAVFVWPGLIRVAENPLQLGATIVCLGLGINQLSAPLRRLFGRAA